MIIFEINVGGIIFQTNYEKLSMLQNIDYRVKDNDGRIFIDRNAEFFRIILSFLQNGVFQEVSKRNIQLFNRELKFYGLPYRMTDSQIVEYLNHPFPLYLSFTCVKPKSGISMNIFKKDYHSEGWRLIFYPSLNLDIEKFYAESKSNLCVNSSGDLLLTFFSSNRWKQIRITLNNQEDFTKSESHTFSVYNSFIFLCPSQTFTFKKYFHQKEFFSDDGQVTIDVIWSDSKSSIF